MISSDTIPFGDFTIFGFTRDPGFVEQRLSDRLGITAKTIEIGAVGQFFYYTSYGDVAESEQGIVLKLGFLRSTAKSALSAQQLVEKKLVGPRSINYDSFSGNGLVVGLSKTEPVFSAFQTLMAVPQLYYSVSSDGILCSDILRCIVRLMPQIDLDETILPQHFLFRSVYGSSTYFRDVKRLIPGHILQWTDGSVGIKLVRSLDAVSEEAQYIRDDALALNLVHDSLQDVVSDYTSQIEVTRHEAATLLSGGVDSSLIQYFIKNTSSQQPWRSISFSTQVPAFEFEIDYAHQASELFHTEHTFVNYTPQDYPNLLIRTIDILGQPPNLETEPSFLAVAEYLRAMIWPERIYFTGQGGDTLFGGEVTRKLKGLQYIRKIPIAVPLLKFVGNGLAPITPHISHTMLKGAEIISSRHDPDAYASPSNSVCVYVLDENWDIIQRCFGNQSLRKTLEDRRNLVGQYSTSQHYLDKVYFIDLTTDLWELGVQRQQLFLSHKIEQASPYFDEDVIKTALTIHPDIRYIKGFRYKHLLKDLLHQKTNASVSYKRKGPSTVNDDIVTWMHSGSLRPLVDDIHRPDFMSKVDFDRLINKPDYFVWPLLTLDIFKKRILKNHF